jgi:DNA invertase Pin-like site-specific DNA recombinase
VDEGISGKKDRRPALDRMLHALRRHEVEAVAVVRLDRSRVRPVRPAAPLRPSGPACRSLR